MNRLLVLFVAVAAAAAYVAWPREARTHETLTTTVLFDREIVQILNTRCVMCHAADAPSFPLETYEQTWLRRRAVRDQVIAQHMPPWPAVAGYGEFANDNGLTLRETQFVVSWVEGLGPRNAGAVFTNTVEPGARPAEVRAAMLHAGHWHLGNPDLVRRLPPARIDAKQPSHVRRVTVDLGLTSPRRIRAVEFMPGDRRVLRAAFFTVRETGQWIGSWTPWYGFAELPDGAAYTLPVGSQVVAELHYRGAADAVTDESTLGLSYAARGPVRPVSDIVLQPVARAASGAQARRLRAQTRLTMDTYAVALRPDITGDVSSLEVSARAADGSTTVLLFARDIDTEWPTPFVLKEPVLLRRGTVVSVTAYGSNRQPVPAMRLTMSVFR